jgi:uncharacterized protein YjbJ (UPF0337 family)
VRENRSGAPVACAFSSALMHAIVTRSHRRTAPPHDKHPHTRAVGNNGTAFEYISATSAIRIVQCEPPLHGGSFMSTRDIVAGKTKQIVGKANDVIGAARGNFGQQLKGKTQKVAGKVQEIVGKADNRVRRHAKDKADLACVDDE